MKFGIPSSPRESAFLVRRHFKPFAASHPEALPDDRAEALNDLAFRSNCRFCSPQRDAYFSRRETFFEGIKKSRFLIAAAEEEEEEDD